MATQEEEGEEEAQAAGSGDEQVGLACCCLCGLAATRTHPLTILESAVFGKRMSCLLQHATPRPYALTISPTDHF